MPKGHQKSQSNFRGEGHPQRRSRVYYNSEPEEMFDQCTVKDAWTVSTDTNSGATDDLKVTFDVGNKKLTLDIDIGAHFNILSNTSEEKISSIVPISDSNVIINGVGTKVKSYGQMSLPCKDKDAERLLV